MTRRILTTVLLLVTLGTVGVTSAETPDELTELTKQCKSGDASGCFSLGWMYAEGEGVTQDKFKAMELYQKACDGQYAGGCFNLGTMYDNGTTNRSAAASPR